MRSVFNFSHSSSNGLLVIAIKKKTTKLSQDHVIMRSTKDITPKSEAYFSETYCCKSLQELKKKVMIVSLILR
jgi:hypothetical protein